VRFGAFIPQGWRLDLVGIPVDRQWSSMLGVAHRIEELGYESVWVYDHFHTVPEPIQEPTFEAWTLMSALAATTERVRLGQMCTCNSYRPPAYLAKVAACVDVISGGRLEFGIGAGWYEHEYVGYGYTFAGASTRIGQLREAVEIIRRLWSEDTVSYEGDYYRLSGAISRPHPVQDPHPAIWVGGGGEKLTLRVAAAYAQCTNFGQSPEEFRHKSDVLAHHCREIGTDFDAIVRSTNFNVVCEESEAAVEDRIAWIRDHYRPFVAPGRLDRMERMWRATAGTPEQLVERFEAWRKAGLDYAIVYFAEAAYESTGLELFATEVMPRLVDP
jgi:F420-dependent oxidoreductase-like protein